MQKAIFGLAFALVAGAVSIASAWDYSLLLPYSNELNGSVVTSTAITPSAVAVSSISPTRVDTALNASLATALGDNYKRAEIQLQILDAALVNCGYSATAVTTQTAGGFQFEVDKHPRSIAVGKAIGIWCQGIASTATFIVGGLGYR